MATTSRTYKAYGVNTYKDNRDGSSGSSVSAYPFAWTDSFNGSSNPAWKGQVRSKTNATTVASWSKELRHSDGVLNLVLLDAAVKKYRLEYRRRGFIIPFTTLPAVLSTSYADANARIAFLEKIRALQTSFQGGTFLGELREAIHGIKHPLAGLRKSVDTLISVAGKNRRQALRAFGGRVGSSRAAHAAVRAVTDTWLEWQYDKRPLISDISDLAQAITDAPSADFVGVKASVTDNAVHSVKGDTSDVGYAPCHVVYTLMCSRRTYVRYLGAVGFSSPNPRENVLRKFGLDWSNVAPTLWELTPYSFLVDYFSNAGALIDAASVVDFEVVWGCKTIRQESVSTLLSAELTGYPADRLVSQNVDVYDYTYSKHSGSRSSFNGADLSVSCADLRLKLPGVDSLKWLNIGALIAGSKVPRRVR